MNPARPTISLLLKLGVAPTGPYSASIWSPILTVVCEDAQINTETRLAMFLANVLHETGALQRLTENLNYSVAGLRMRFGSHRGITPAVAEEIGRTPWRKADQRRIANTIYGGEWGRQNLGNTEKEDGWLYRGRNVLQTTGRHNYERLAKVLKRPLDPALLAWLETPGGAASGGIFWRHHGINAIADTGDVAGVRRIINGGSIGLDEVERLYRRAVAEMRESA